jgi:phosphocarrier protein
MVTKEITVKNKLGLHARAAVKLVNLANRFESSVSIEKDGNIIDGKSVLGTLTLAATKGSSITLRITGKDEEIALESLEALINDKFYEDE